MQITIENDDTKNKRGIERIGSPDGTLLPWGVIVHTLQSPLNEYKWR
jgi:hypothetical protein